MARFWVLLFALAAGARGDVYLVHAWINQQFAEAETVAVGQCLGVRLRDPDQPAERDGHLVRQDYSEDYSVSRLYKGTAGMKATVLLLQRNPDWGPPACRKGPVLLFLNHDGSADTWFGIRYFPGGPPPGGGT